MKVNRPIYSPTLKANMPIFEAAPHFIERLGAELTLGEPSSAPIQDVSSHETVIARSAATKQSKERRVLYDPWIASHGPKPGGRNDDSSSKCTLLCHQTLSP